jgi:hypothetical protein
LSLTTTFPVPGMVAVVAFASSPSGTVCKGWAGSFSSAERRRVPPVLVRHARQVNLAHQQVNFAPGGSAAERSR